VYAVISGINIYTKIPPTNFYYLPWSKHIKKSYFKKCKYNEINYIEVSNYPCTFLPRAPRAHTHSSSVLI